MITINRSTFDEDNARKTILFTFSFPVILTFDLLSSLDLRFAPWLLLSSAMFSRN